MAVVYLVRHGEAAASWAESNDPGLSGTGQQQAKLACEQLVTLPAMPIVSSPKLRAIETAQPLAQHWGSEVVIEPRVTEVPTPSDIEDRAVWLKQVMKSDWPQMTEAMVSWQYNIVAALAEADQDCVVFCHFMVINAAAAYISQQPEVLQQMPDYASVHEIEVSAGKLVSFKPGKQLTTKVL